MALSDGLLLASRVAHAKTGSGLDSFLRPKFSMPFVSGVMAGPGYLSDWIPQKAGMPHFLRHTYMYLKYQPYFSYLSFRPRSRMGFRVMTLCRDRLIRARIAPCMEVLLERKNKSMATADLQEFGGGEGRQYKNISNRKKKRETTSAVGIMKVSRASFPLWGDPQDTYSWRRE